jgi:GrpB-like predicted nucleotidyltransferase (UPF0157 family)
MIDSTTLGQKQPDVAPVEEYEVRVVPYDSEWPSRYAQEAEIVSAALAGCVAAIEHFGSTAVPGLSAKPIIDILVGSLDGLPPTLARNEALRKEGYVYLGEDGRRPGRCFWRKRGPIDFNLSLVPYQSDLWLENLLFRDYLRMHPNDVQHYAAIKHEAVRMSPRSLVGYQEHKRAYIQELKERAHRWHQTQHRDSRPLER